MKYLLPLALLALAGVSAMDTTADGPTPTADIPVMNTPPAMDTTTKGSGGDDNSDGCLANYIVTRCLETETKKISECNSSDWDCLCAAYQAVATCYNNCPTDSRAVPARQQVDTSCKNASLYGSKAHSTTASPNASQETQLAAKTTAEVVDSDSTVVPSGQATNTATFSASNPQKTSGASGLAENAGSLLIAVAGAVAAVW